MKLIPDIVARYGAYRTQPHTSFSNRAFVMLTRRPLAELDQHQQRLHAYFAGFR